MVNFKEKWSVDRYGRLLSGSVIFLFSALGLINPIWYLGSLATGTLLVITSLTNKCLLHDFLIHLGAKEREDLFLPKHKNQSTENKINHNLEAESKPERKASSFSRALKSIQKEITFNAYNSPASDNEKIHIKVANNLKQREAAYQLASETYKSCGYVNDFHTSLHVQSYDIRSDTITFISLNHMGDVVGSITVVSNKSGQLPSDQIFHNELSCLYQDGKIIVEATRFVTDKTRNNSKDVINNLLNQIFIYAISVLQADEMVIEVNPRHAGFYQRLLCFEKLGDEKPCDRVNGAPAVLLRVPLQLAKNKIEEGRSNSKPDRKCLYHSFMSKLDETEAVQEIKKDFKPMSEKEMVYFGLKNRSDSTFTNVVN